jgi:hypothetical protein
MALDDLATRLRDILGDPETLDFEAGLDRFAAHLQEHLKLPCEATGREDFNWEEYYDFGPGDEAEYEQLRRSQPSCQDRYELLSLDPGTVSEWMLYDEDIACHCRRKSDGRTFILGLAELRATDRKSPNHLLLNDYSDWFTNNR